MEMKKNIDIEASDWLGEQFQPVSEIDSGAKKICHMKVHEKLPVKDLSYCVPFC